MILDTSSPSKEYVQKDKIIDSENPKQKTFGLASQIANYLGISIAMITIGSLSYIASRNSVTKIMISDAKKIKSDPQKTV